MMNSEALFNQEKTLILQKIDQYMIKIANVNDQKKHDFLYQAFLQARFEISKATSLNEITDICLTLDDAIKQAEQYSSYSIQPAKTVVLTKDEAPSKPSNREDDNPINNDSCVETTPSARDNLHQQQLDMIRKLKTTLKKDDFLGWRQYKTAQKVVQQYTKKIKKVTNMSKVDILYQKGLSIVERLSYEDDYDTGSRILKKARWGLFLSTLLSGIACLLLGYFFEEPIIKLYKELPNRFDIIVLIVFVSIVFGIWVLRYLLMKLRWSLTLLFALFTSATFLLSLVWHQGLLGGYFIACLLNFLNLVTYAIRKTIIVKKYSLSSEGF